MAKRKTPDLVDVDGRTWVWDTKARVWYAPDHGLEFGTREELDEQYGPTVEKVASR